MALHQSCLLCSPCRGPTPPGSSHDRAPTRSPTREPVRSPSYWRSAGRFWACPHHPPLLPSCRRGGRDKGEHGGKGRANGEWAGVGPASLNRACRPLYLPWISYIPDRCLFAGSQSSSGRLCPFLQFFFPTFLSSRAGLKRAGSLVTSRDRHSISSGIMATATSAFPLATEDPYTGPGSASGGGGPADSAAGASGSTPGAIEISHGALIAIIVIVCVVGVFGSKYQSPPARDPSLCRPRSPPPARTDHDEPVTTSVLFYVAKKREWKVRETIRRSARKVVTALTPRRSEFPRSVKDGNSSKSSKIRGRGVRIDDAVPPTPRLPVDLEKGMGRK